ncbi:MAG TPA: hypothetical protein VK672_07475 [Solirubrobacteraceae bacterium]|nr:hypothetical protein [Solirubrobacteraceae bacterium]
MKLPETQRSCRPRPRLASTVAGSYYRVEVHVLVLERVHQLVGHDLIEHVVGLALDVAEQETVDREPVAAYRSPA